MRKPIFAYAKTKTQISCAVTAKLISTFVFATRIVQFLFYLNPKFQVSGHLLRLYSPVCVGPGRMPLRPVFSRRGSIMKQLDGTCMTIQNKEEKRSYLPMEHHLAFPHYDKAKLE